MANPVTLTIYKDYTKYNLDPADIMLWVIPGHAFLLYHLDYLAEHFGEMIRREIRDNPEVINKSTFQTLITWYLEYIRILRESRVLANKGQAVGPFGSDKKLYACRASHPYGPELNNDIKANIASGVINRKKYDNAYNYTGNVTFINNDDSQGIRATDYKSGCGELGNLIVDVITPLARSWETYIASKFIPEEDFNKHLLDQFRRDFNRNLATINDNLENGEYRETYDLMENILDSSSSYLDNLASAANTEENIIEKTINLADYYEKMNFIDADLDMALVKKSAMTSSKDLIDKSELSAEQKKSLKKFAKLTSIDLTSHVYGYSKGVKSLSSAGILGMDALTLLGTTRNIDNPSSQLLDLMKTSIYKDKNNAKQVGFITETRQKNLDRDNLIKQRNYLERITSYKIMRADDRVNFVKDGANNDLEVQFICQNPINPGDISQHCNMTIDTGAANPVIPQGTQVATTRLAKYLENYDPQVFRGGSKTNKYQYTKKSTQRMALSQTGGRDIDIDKLEREVSFSKTNLKEINDQIKASQNLISKQDQLYAQSSIGSIEQINQRNYFLIEMMNIMKLYTILLNEETLQHNNFFNQFDDLTKKFKTDLLAMWNILDSRLDMGGTLNETALEKLMADGSITMAQLSTLLKSVGLEAQLADIPDIEAINDSYMLKLLLSLKKRYLGSENSTTYDNMRFIVNDLSRIMNVRTVSSDEKKQSVEDMYKKLFTHYKKVKSLNSRLRTEYEKIQATADRLNPSYLNSVASFAGEVIETNLDTTNTFIREMIAVIKNFSINASHLETYRKEIVQSKSRMNDYTIFVKDIRNKIIPFETVLDASHDGVVSTVKHDIAINYFSDFYETYITDYTDKLANASNNVIKYNSYQKDLGRLNEEKWLLDREILDFKILYSKSNPPINGTEYSIINLLQNIKNIDNLKIFFKYLNSYPITLFPDLMAQIYMPVHLQELADELSAPNLVVVQKVLDDYIQFDTLGNLEKISGLTTQDQIDLAKRSAESAIKYLNLLKLYSVNGGVTVLGDGVTVDAAIPALSNILADYINNETDANLKVLVEYVNKIALNATLDAAKIKIKVDQYFIRIYEMRGGDAVVLDKEIIDGVTDDIVSEIRTLAANYYSAYYQKLSKLYEMFTGLSIVNSQTNPSFNDLMQKEHDLAELRTNTKKIALVDSYLKLDSTPNLIKPIGTDNAGGDQFAPYDFSSINPIDPDVVTRNILQAMNEYNGLNNYGYKLFDLEDKIPGDMSHNKLINTIYNDYNKFARTALPTITLMSDELNNGIKIVNSTGSTYKLASFDLIDQNDKKYQSQYNYNNTLLINPIGIKKTYLFMHDKLSVLYNYNGSQVIFIPSYRDDILALNGTKDKLNYTITPATQYKYRIKIQVETIPEIIIGVAEKVELKHVQQISKLAKTGELVTKFLNQMVKHKNTIKTLAIEALATWDKDKSLITDKVYGERIIKKRDLLKVLRVLHEIDSEIKGNEGNYYGLNQALIDNKKQVGKTITYTNCISDAIYELEALDPKSEYFNRGADKMWIFTRKLFLAWYTIFAHIESSFILNLSVNGIIKFVQLINNQMVIADLYKIDDTFKPYTDDIHYYYQIVTDEIDKKTNTIHIAQSDFPVETDGTKLVPQPDVKFKVNKIDSAVVDQIKFNHSHTNDGDSTKIYKIIALSNDSTILEPLVKVRQLSEEITKMVVVIRPLLNSDYPYGYKLIDIVTQPPPQNKRIDELIDMMIRLNNAFINNLSNNFESNGMGNPEFWITTRQKINQLFANVRGWIKLPDAAPLPLNLIVGRSAQSFTNKEFQSQPVSDLIYQTEYQFIAKTFTNGGNAGSAFFEFYMTDIYRIVFSQFKNYLVNQMTLINSEISKTAVQDLINYKTVFNSYYNSTVKAINEVIYNTANQNTLSNVITNPPTDTNNTNIKFVLWDGSQYTIAKKLIDEIASVVTTITDVVKPNLKEYYEIERNLYNSLIGEELELRKIIVKNSAQIRERASRIKYIINSISEVMFNEHYKKFAMVESSKLLELLQSTQDNYDTIGRMIEQKMNSIVSKGNYHALAMSQVKSYATFKSAADKLINNTPIVSKIYYRMSFGLTEYYMDILDTIVQCLESKDITEMTDIQTYLYKYHYIQLKRCQALFQWINKDYQSRKRKIDVETMAKLTPIERKNYDSIITKKINTLEAGGDIGLVFFEFHALRKLLDDYSAVEMEKVQLHLRLNDFSKKEYNDGLGNNSDVEFLKDTDPNSAEYLERWNKRDNVDGLMFTNTDNLLHINFKKLEAIYSYETQHQTRDFQTYYSDVYDKTKPPSKGIPFQRIYNKLTFPESDVISNYMSISPNINLGKGTVLMTYGYSGTGKSASLFGMEGPPPTNGILQATLDQFDLAKSEIYFRVYEIYGLGTQYNYHWNPSDPTGQLCYPDFYQCIIHHELDTSSTQLGVKNSFPLTNRHDMLSYILDLKDPENGRFEARNDMSTVGGFAKSTKGSGEIVYTYNKSTYGKINEQHYRNFAAFTKIVEKKRKDKGINFERVLDQIIKQVKGTINNPDSSRSILVYDFEINLDKTKAITDRIYVPFLIYDLPGKEDISRTYINSTIKPGLTDESKNNTFDDINGDNSYAKERKSTYVLNPILIPVFDNNHEVVANVLKNISSDPENALAPKINVILEKKIVAEILNHQITNFNYRDGPANTDYQENGAPFTLSTFYNQLNLPETFLKLLDMNSLVFPEDDVSDIAESYFFDNGIAGLYPEYINETITEDIIKINLMKNICIVVMAFLIKYQLFDLVAEITSQCADPVNNGDRVNGTNGGWSNNKIYAFYEAFYINENVVGLLQYLVNNILEKNSDISEQYDTENKFDISHYINTNIKLANRYLVLEKMNELDPTGNVGDEFGLAINPDLLSDPDKLKQQDIKDFINRTNSTLTPENPFFADEFTEKSGAFRRIKNVVQFENIGKYNSNKIFRKGTGPNSICSPALLNPDDDLIINPLSVTNNTIPVIQKETNRPLIQDFIEPYEQKIAFYYVFYVMSNSQMLTKAEEQVKLLNNSMPFVNKVDITQKKGC